MGFQDRDYYREGEGTGAIQSVVVKLMIVSGLVFLAELLFMKPGRPDNPVVDLLAVHGDTLLRPLYWWQYLTAGFVHSQQDIWHIVFNLLGLYVFGRRLEEKYGPREFLRFYLLAIVVGFIVWNARVFLMVQSYPAEMQAQALARYACLGASGGVTALTLLFCLLYPRATLLLNFLFPVPAWVVGVIVIATNLFGVSMPGGSGIAYDVHLVGAAFAVVYWYFGLHFGRLPGIGQLGKLLTVPQKWLTPRPPLKVHDPEQYYEDLDAEGDRLLEKVRNEGLDSLTQAERQMLEDYSRRMRQKLR